MPIEKSLQALRPRQLEAPACQARRWNGTYCTMRPSRRTSACAETRRPATWAKYGSASGGRLPQNMRSIHGPP
jgi:hypothetical protein